MAEVTTESNAQATGNQGSVANADVKTNDNNTTVNTDSNTQSVETNVQEPVKEDIPITGEAFKEFKDFYAKKLDTLQKDMKGKDQKITELQKILNKQKEESLTDEQKRELERRQIKEEYHNLYVKETIAEFNLKQYDSEMDFSGFFFSGKEDPNEMKEEIQEKGKSLNEYISKAIKTGIEKGVNEKLASGSYIPKSAANGNPSDLKSMTRDQIVEKTKEISKMPSSSEKSKALADLMEEQVRRTTGQ